MNGALGAAILIDTFTASLRSQNTGHLTPGPTVPGNTADRPIILNGWNDIIIRNHKVIFDSSWCLKVFYFWCIFFINNCKLGFV